MKLWPLQSLIITTKLNISLSHLLANVGKSITIKSMILEVFTEILGGPVAHRVPGLMVLIKFPNIVFVDAPVPKSSLISALIENHSILHIVPGIRNDSHYSIDTLRTQPEIILRVVCSPHKRSLWEQYPINLVVHPIWVVVVGRSHGLLGHLTLVHVSG